MKINKFIIALLAVVAGISTLSAQNGTLTPYSRYGYGILRDNATAAQQSMGGVGIAMNSGRQINVMNPASYARVDSLTFLFDMGIDFTTLWSHEKSTANGDVFQRQNGGGLNYITMQFPVSKRLGVSLGILPYTSVGYSFGSAIENGSSSHSGSGSINQAYLGLGGKIVGGFNVGINFAYLFGTTANDNYAITNQGSQTLFQDEISVRDWRMDLGAQYTQMIGRQHWTLGFVWSPARKLHGHLSTYAYDVSQDGTATPEIERVKLQDGYGTAASYGVGLNVLHNQRIMVEADFIYQPWSKVDYRGLKNQFADRTKIALGVQFQPTLRGGYLKRIQYRLGGYYNNDYLKVRDNRVKEYGASMGFGFPVPGYKTVVNLGLGWVHRQASPAALIKEDYFNITFGINFNETWFEKFKLH